MPRQPNIRITGKDRELLRKTNKNVLNKKSRVRLNYGVELDQVKTKSVEDFKTRKEFNKYIQNMQSFTNRNNLNFQYEKNKNGVVVTKKEMNEIDRQITRINRRKKAELKRLEKQQFKDRGKPTTLTVGEQKGLMGDIRYADLKEMNFNFDRFRSKKEFEQYKEGIKRNYRGDFIKRKNQLYKRNYLQALENIFGDLGMDLKEHIKNMSLDDFINKYYTENIADIGFIYDYLDAKTKLQELEGIFEL